MLPYCHAVIGPSALPLTNGVPVLTNSANSSIVQPMIQVPIEVVFCHACSCCHIAWSIDISYFLQCCRDGNRKKYTF